MQSQEVAGRISGTVAGEIYVKPRHTTNYVPADFIVLDIDCNPTCPIILGRPFLRTIGAIIDMKEGNIRFQFPLRKGM